MILIRALALPLLALLLTGCASLASDRMAGHLRTVMLAQDDPETVRAAAPAFLLLVAIVLMTPQVPDLGTLTHYQPKQPLRVFTSDGVQIGGFGTERRVYQSIEQIPKLMKDSLLAVEDARYYEHGGIDFTGMARAAVLYAQNFGSNKRPQGASTITQQVAKNFLLTNEVSFTRKIKEALLAMRIERTYSKDKILELYLNEIYLGLGAYGVAAASLVYFDKSVNELTIAEASYLAALPKAPSSLHPVKNRDRAIERRNYVIDRLVENGWIKQTDADKARKDPMTVTSRSNAAHIFAGEYFAEEVRRELVDMLFVQPYCRIGNLVEGGIAKRQTASVYLKQLADLGMLVAVEMGREKVFVHKSFLRLLQSDEHAFSSYEDGKG